jgi:hypothetical protein
VAVAWLLLCGSRLHGSEWQLLGYFCVTATCMVLSDSCLVAAVWQPLAWFWVTVAWLLLCDSNLHGSEWQLLGCCCVAAACMVLSDSCLVASVWQSLAWFWVTVAWLLLCGSRLHGSVWQLLGCFCVTVAASVWQKSLVSLVQFDIDVSSSNSKLQNRFPHHSQTHLTQTQTTHYAAINR